METPSWRFWLFGVVVIVGLEVFSVLWALSQGYVWVWMTEEVSAEYWMGALMWYAIVVVAVAYGSAWIWQKIRKE